MMSGSCLIGCCWLTAILLQLAEFNV
jgi:hypothetical protein